MLAFAVAAGTLCVASPAAAAPPTRTELVVTSEYPVTGVCDKEITVNSIQEIIWIDYYDQSGDNIIRSFLHIVEQDTFTANGKTLTGLPFTFNIEGLFDSEGNQTHLYADGLVEKIPLPDGSLFVSAGRLDFWPEFAFRLSPDVGNPGNIAGFCAAFGLKPA